MPLLLVVAFLASVAAALLPAGAGASVLPPLRGDRADVWAVGDGAVANKQKNAIPVAEMIEAHDPDRFLYLGDVYRTGTALEFLHNYDPIYGRFNSIAAPTIGGHEAGNLATGYDPYWLLVFGRPLPHRYSFRVGKWQFLSLNSEEPHGPGSPQLAWLKRKLGTTAKLGSCRIAYMHPPRYSAGLHGDDLSLDPIWKALGGRARLVLAGHDHDMQRIRPHRKIVQLVAGAGGRELYELHPYDGLRFGDDTHFGALHLHLDGRRVTSRFVTADGTVLDSSRRRCRPEPG